MTQMNPWIETTMTEVIVVMEKVTLHLVDMVSPAQCSPFHAMVTSDTQGSVEDQAVLPNTLAVMAIRYLVTVIATAYHLDTGVVENLLASEMVMTEMIVAIVAIVVTPVPNVRL